MTEKISSRVNVYNKLEGGNRERRGGLNIQTPYDEEHDLLGPQNHWVLEEKDPLKNWMQVRNEMKERGFGDSRKKHLGQKQGFEGRKKRSTLETLCRGR